MTAKIAVLGAGRVGRTIATDLSNYFKVSSFDVSNENLLLLKNEKIQCIQTDLAEYSQYKIC